MEKIRVLLVDDDRLAISYMKEIVDWENLGYEIVGTAYNGKQALKLFDQCSPHLVITDISMPHMDGIELSKRIKECSKDIRVVLLTSYGEFEYARQAVQLGIDYYLIKDEIDGSYMEEKLNALKSLILDQARISQIMFQKAIADYFQMGEDYIKRAYKDKALYDFWSKEHSYILVEQNLPIALEEKWELKVKAPNLPELLELSLKIAANCKVKVEVFSILPENRILLGLESQERSRYKEQQKSYYVSEKIRSSAANAWGARYTAYVSLFPMRFSELYEQLMNQNGITSAKLYLGTGKTYGITENPWRKEERSAVMVSGDYFAAAIHEKKFLEKLREIYDACYLYKNMALPFLRNMRLAYRALAAERRNVLGFLAESDFMDKPLYDFTEIIKWLGQYYEWIEKRRIPGKGNSQKTGRAEVEKAVLYIKEHYTDSQLKVSDIAEFLNISESRISVLFKAETGQTLIQYLTQVRIETAKKLLRTSEYKVYEVAEMVGYANSQYLSKVFHKETGYFPLEYKNGNENNE